jgi:hypothetical protein
MTGEQVRLEKCNYGCYFIDGRSVSKEEFEKANPVVGGKSIAESIIPCPKPCATCGHAESEHTAAGCQLSPDPPQPHGNPQNYLCGCDRFLPSPH